MNIVSVVFIALISVCLIVILRKNAPEFAVPVSVVASVIILLISIVFGKSVFEKIETIAASAEIDSDNLKVIFKSLGICYLVQIGKDICCDSGESALGDKIDLAGKIAITTICIPIITQVLELILELVKR